MENQKFETVLVPKTKLLSINFKELFRYKDLIFLFIKRNFVAYYKQTVLGPAWAIIQPFLTTVVFTLVFGNVAGLAADGVPSFIFYFSGTILWTYFSTCLSATSTTFVTNSGILGKVYFPRLVMPISTVLSNLISFGIQFIFFLGFYFFFLFTGQGIQPNWYILMTPMLIIQLALLSLGFGVIISSMTTKYRDLAMLVGFGTQLWMYASPVAYDMYRMEIFAPGGSLHVAYMCNPVTPIINIFRYAFLGIGEVEWIYYFISIVITAFVFSVGVILFNRVEKTFMDTV